LKLVAGLALALRRDHSALVILDVAPDRLTVSAARRLPQAPLREQFTLIAPHLTGLDLLGTCAVSTLEPQTHPPHDTAPGRGRTVPAQQEPRVERRLAAIFAADIAGYSRLVSQDEARTLRTLAAAREVMDRLIRHHGGRIANTAGDSVLAEFPSAVDAVQCAVAVQEKLAEASAGEPEDRRLQFRIGIHVGDVVVRGGDLLGDGVNIAARLEGLAEPGGIAISGAAHGHVRKALPLAYTDLGQQHVKNIDESVRALDSATAPPSTSQPKQPLPWPDKPSIAVLPFTNMSGPEDEYFCDGMVEDIITALSKVRTFFVIARNSSFTYKGRAVNVKQVGRELGVRYVLEGSVRRAGSKLRITGQLIEAATGHHVWADRFDGETADVFALQDEITQQVVSAIEPSLRAIEIERAKSKPTESLAAYDLYLRALPEFHSVTEQGFHRAKALLREALARDPNFADAWAALADCLARMLIQGWVEEFEAVAPEACEAALNGVSADPENGTVLAVAAWTLCMLDGRHDQGIDFARRALRLHPNSAFVRMCCGWAFVFNADQDEALKQFEVAHRLSPVDPREYLLLTAVAGAHLFKRNFEEVLIWTERALERKQNAIVALRYRIIALAYLGKVEEATTTMQRMLVFQPNFGLGRLKMFTFRYPWMIGLIHDGLRLAGAPE